MRRWFQKTVLGLFDAARLLSMLGAIITAIVVMGLSTQAIRQLLRRFIGSAETARQLALPVGLGIGALLLWKGTPRLVKLMAWGLDYLQGAFEEWQGLAGPPPTASWHADPGVPLVFDLGRHSFCGVRLGQPIGKLAFLGRAASPLEARRGVLRFPARDVVIIVREDRLASATVLFGRKAGASSAGEVVFRRDGRTLPLAGGLTEQEVIACLGPPTRREEDEAGLELVYVSAGVEWWVSIGTDGRLEAFEQCLPMWEETCSHGPG